jgi:hypothetical protein
LRQGGLQNDPRKDIIFAGAQSSRRTDQVTVYISYTIDRVEKNWEEHTEKYYKLILLVSDAKP